MNPLYSLFNGQPVNQPQNFMTRFNSFVRDFRRTSNMTPEQKVRDMLAKGQMTQEQFEAYRQQVNRFTGMNM